MVYMSADMLETDWDVDEEFIAGVRRCCFEGLEGSCRGACNASHHGLPEVESRRRRQSSLSKYEM